MPETLRKRRRPLPLFVGVWRTSLATPTFSRLLCEMFFGGPSEQRTSFKEVNPSRDTAKPLLFFPRFPRIAHLRSSQVHYPDTDFERATTLAGAEKNHVLAPYRNEVRPT